MRKAKRTSRRSRRRRHGDTQTSPVDPRQQSAVSRAARERLLFGQRLSEAGIRGPVRVWRGVPSYADDDLRTGDLVTTDEEQARLYSGRRGKVIEADVDATKLTYHQWTGRSEVELRYVGARPVGRVVWRTDPAS